jgi:UPF0271 protein
MRFKVDINCDLGEGFGHFKAGYDNEIMPFITSANIACGFHAGDPVIMARTVKLAQDNGVSVGAHPGFPDLLGFGRRYMELSYEDLRNTIIYQVGALKTFAEAANTKLQHVKPHGALYNTASENEAHAECIIEAVHTVDSNLVLFALANSKMAMMASKAGLRVASEVFADRAYNQDGSLVSREIEGALISDPKVAALRAVSIIKEKKVAAINDQTVEFRDAHTICVHSDTLNALEIVKELRRSLLNSQIDVKPVGYFV